MAGQKFYEGQEFHNPNDPNAPVLIYRAGKFTPKPAAGAPAAVSPDALQSGQVVLSAIAKARNQANGLSTGLLGGWGTKLPGSPGYNLDRTTDTIKGNLSFGKLMQMKQSSPTGASGLGALSEGENRMLQSLAGSLDVGQGEKQFRQNLDDVEQYVTRGTPGIATGNPLNLGGGQSREQIPRGAYYMDPQGNVRRNENGDKGNPIVKPAQAQQAQAAGPQPGHVEDGYQYLGGPKGDPKSWRKVQ